MKEIPGVNYKPKTIAACLVNIRKAYSILKNKAQMKRKYLNDEELIYKGRRDVILEFLQDIKDCYKLATKNIIKTKQIWMNVKRRKQELSFYHKVQQYYQLFPKERKHMLTSNI